MSKAEPMCMRTRPGVRSREPAVAGDDVIAVRSGMVRFTTIFKMADFDLSRNSQSINQSINHAITFGGLTGVFFIGYTVLNCLVSCVRISEQDV